MNTVPYSNGIEGERQLGIASLNREVQTEAIHSCAKPHCSTKWFVYTDTAPPNRASAAQSEIGNWKLELKFVKATR